MNLQTLAPSLSPILFGRYAKRFALGVFTIAGIVSASPDESGAFIIPIQDRTIVFEHHDPNSKKQFYVGTRDRLHVIRTKDNYILVRDTNEREGWVEKNCCVTSGKTSLRFDPQTIEGKHGTDLQICWVDGKSGIPDTPIILQRSFAGALRENVDKETVVSRAKR